MMDSKQINPRRRFFLTAASCAPVLAVAAVISGKNEVVEEVLPPAPVQPETSVGYHETEHIRNYYSTAAYL